MAEVTLRKYKNRRLYCARQSRYVTVEDVRRRLVDGERVLDWMDRDVTVEVLVNMIQIDARKGNRPALTYDALRRFVRSYLT